MAESSIPPVTQKDSSHGAMIGGSVAMAVIIAALLYWRLGGNEEPVTDPPPPPPPKVETAKKPTFEAPPPPPPPEEEMPEEEPKKPSSTKSKGPAKVSGCAADCQGKVTGALRSSLRSKAGQARGCYERALRQNAMLQGRMTVQVKVSPSGSVCSVGVTQNSIGDASVTTCVQQIFRSGGYSKPEGGCVTAAVPIKFEPKQ